ncbi:MAG: hypothetical protein H0W50_04470 [Parachlamydiaceae bacterium]|nr:hypothetical protein [Parachlamydiaceae bacterium]
MQMKIHLKNLSFYFVVLFLLVFRLQLDATLYNFNFSESNQGWTGDFADYPIGEEAFYELSWGWANLPQALPANNKAMVLSGNNHSDDLMMFLKKQVSGLEPNRDYKVDFVVTIETKIPTYQFGIGGSPGESVFFKVGASTQEPVKVVRNDYYRLNIDVGIQGNSGVNGVVIGNLAHSGVDPINPTFEPKEMNSSSSLHATTDREGKLWLFVGTDSGFEGLSMYYVANVAVEAILCGANDKGP